MPELTERIGEHVFTNPTTADFQSVSLALYHNHLPRLEEAGVISYDREVGTVRPGGNFDPLHRALEGANLQ